MSARPPASRRAWLFSGLLLLFLSAVPPPCRAGERAPSAAADLIATTERAGLAADPVWRALLHLGPGSGESGRTSRIDDPRFFLAADGRTDPDAELRATLEAFLAPGPLNDDHAICRFPARFAWLAGRLGLEPARFPQPACADYARYREIVNPRAAVLVFPEGYSNSPATMFGHTLLRLDSGAESGLLSTAVSYAAATDESFGPLYAVKGLFGLYLGYYYVNPYWDKINQYTYMESRDIWEYRLDLASEELQRLAQHLWEIKDLGSRYYFFDENCASNLLVFLEVARPSFDFSKRFTLWAAPLDTIRAVIDAGIVREIVYRPSRTTRLRALAAPLPPAAQELAVRIARGETAPESAGNAGLDPSLQARALDAAAELHQMSAAAAGGTQEERARRLLGILRVRSLLPTPDYPVPQPARPEQGHRSLLVAAGAGSFDGRSGLALRFRPVYHGLLDPSRGYRKGAAIAFGDTELRWRDGEDPRLERFSLIDISSLAPVDRFLRPNSWQVGLGVERELLAGAKQRTTGAFSWLMGRTVAPVPRAFLYALAGIETRVGGALPSLAAVGPVARAGLLFSPLEGWNANISGSWASFVLGERRDRWSLRLGQGWALGENVALELTLSRSGTDGAAATDAGLMLNFYL